MNAIGSFSEFRARPFLKEQLMRPVKAGRIVHARLFSGPDGTGKRTAALLLSRAMNCTGAGEKPCNHCPSCLQFLSGNSPRLIYVEPEKNAIRVDAIRELIEKIHLRPDGGVMCVIINEADKMNESAQNALLKTLEEAPEYASFILVTDKPGALLPTIHSRCQMCRFSPLSEEDVKNILIENGQTEARAKEEAERAEGSAGRAFGRIQNENWQKIYLRAVDALKNAKKPSDVAGAFGKIAQDKDNAQEILDIYEHEARRMMRAGEGEAGEKAGSRLLSAVIEARKQLKANVSFQSAMEMLFFDKVGG